MNIIQKIKELFSDTVATATAEAKFKDAKTQDGQILKITDDLVIGAKVEIVSEDGTLTPAPAGDITLDDGTVLSIDDKGTIAEIATQAQEAGESEMATAPNEVSTADNDRFVALEKEVATLKEALNMIVDGLKNNNTQMESVKAENAKLKTEMSKVKAAPTASFKKTVEKPKKENSKIEMSDMQKRIAELAEKNSK